MSSDFSRYALERVLDRARALGLTAEAAEVSAAITCAGTVGARLWADAHPDDEGAGCCWGDIQKGPDGCTCWTPVFALDQQPPRPPAGPGDLCVRDGLCHDCAYRRNSPERADEYTEDALFGLASTGQPFWCHQGMRRPEYWTHPDGRTIPGSLADWQPPTLAGIPYQADGTPGLLCAGWSARASRHHTTQPDLNSENP